MKIDRQTRNSILLAAVQIAALVGLAWYANRLVEMGPTDARGWRRFAWPFGEDEAPVGRAYSGEHHDVYVWLTLGPGGDCPEGVPDDAALERAVDIRLLDPRFQPAGPGEPLRVTDLVGRTRVYVHKRHNRSPRYGEAVAIPYKCDLITAIIDGDARDPAKRKAAHEFLESNTVQVPILEALEDR
ncbi:MAG: hypothetical protein K2Y40_24840 [Reyranella sp.]|nr:hypothetical protein [Reyranella sp.]